MSTFDEKKFVFRETFTDSGITKGYYRVAENGEIQKFNIDLNKWYASYPEIDGPLGTFSFIHREKELTSKNKQNNNDKNYKATVKIQVEDKKRKS